MKKLIALFLSILMLTVPLFGCSKAQEEDESGSDLEIRIAGMTGPTSIGFVNIMEANAENKAKNKYKFSIHGSADEVVPLIVKGEIDIAAVPVNVASNLYNKTKGEVQVLAVNTLGMLSIVAKGVDVTSVADLKDKTIYASGKGTLTEYTLKYILSKNGIDPDSDVTLEFYSKPDEVIAKISSQESFIAMLPQPAETVVLNKFKDAKAVIDVNKEWSKLQPEVDMVTAVVVVRKEFAKANPEAVADFLSEYKDSINAVNQDNAKAAELVVKHGVFQNAAVIQKAIPKCNITFVAGKDMKNLVMSYLGVLYEYNAQSVGGKLPEDGFFYTE